MRVARNCAPLLYADFTFNWSGTFPGVIPYSAYISRVFNFVNFETFAKLIQLKFEPLGYAHEQVHTVRLLTTASGKESRRSLAQISSSPIDGVQISLYPRTTASTSKEDTLCNDGVEAAGANAPTCIGICALI